MLYILLTDIYFCSSKFVEMKRIKELKVKYNKEKLRRIIENDSVKSLKPSLIIIILYCHIYIFLQIMCLRLHKNRWPCQIKSNNYI